MNECSSHRARERPAHGPKLIDTWLEGLGHTHEDTLSRLFTAGDGGGTTYLMVSSCSVYTRWRQFNRSLTSYSSRIDSVIDMGLESTTKSPILAKVHRIESSGCARILLV
jgi:hypothetical protein